MPFINQPLVPDAASPGGAAFTLTVNGTGFVSGATVDWNGTALTTTFVSSGQLTAAVPASDIASAGTGWVTVVNTGGTASNVVFFPVAASEATASFAQAAGSPIGIYGNQSSIAVGDFNGDGKPDLALVSSNQNYVSILLGKGDGTFTRAASTFPTNTDPVSVAVGDFNGDGNLDLAVADAGISGVTVLLGDGTGNFPSQQDYFTGHAPSSVAVGDFNGDGNLDLAVTNESDSTVAILEGDGTGKFPSVTSVTATGSGAVSLAVGDFNGDGKLDVAVANQNDGDLTILLGNGNGTLTAAASSPATGSGPSSVVVGDFNGDGKLDLATTNQGSGNMTILLGNGDGTFTPTASSPAVGTQPVSAATGDFNGDNKLDLVAANFLDQSATVLLGNGDGTFTAAGSATPTGPSYVRGVTVGDFNGDGRLDFATANVGNSVSILVQAQASVPAVTLSPTSLDFGSLAVSTTSGEKTVTVTNSGSADLTFASGAVSLSGTNAADFAITTDGCSGTTVAASGTCSVGVTFTPSIASSETASLDFADNAAGSPQSVSLSGAGVVPTVTVSPASLTFSGTDVGAASKAQTVTLTNTGSVDMTLTGISIDESDFRESDTCGGSIAASAKCTISVTFKPTASGTRSGTLSISDSAASSPQKVGLSGSGEDFGLSATTTTDTVTAGGSATFNLQLSPQGGFNGTVSLTCSGAPADSTCTVSPASVTLDGTNNTTAKVSVTTTAPSMLLPFAPGPPPMPPVTVCVGLLGLVGLALGWLAWRRRAAVSAGKRLLLVAPLALLILAAPFVLSGCDSTRTPTGGTPKGAATLTVAATSGNLKHSTTMTLIVQ